MKKLAIIFSLIIAMVSSCNKDSRDLKCGFTDFYYYQDEPNVIGGMSEEYILIGSDSSNTNSAIRNFVESSSCFDKNFDFRIEEYSNYRYKHIALKFKKKFSCKKITKIISDIEKNKVVDYAHFGMDSESCKDLYGYPIGEKCIYSYSASFNIKVKDPNELADLLSTIEETNTILIEQNQFMDDWFNLEANKDSQGDAMQMANFFYETGIFVACEPDILLRVVE